ncbi:hypothetical protein GPAL_2571 [Glaciecola pallidula DSM 14239 = ACAM 615]|uniref:Uncharacterized protein n=1 Tax=Brumicola pallidula DSM 14239 = ACAM 615 TaxID=1121922 RepID=K6ZKL0_9ALTE|nr:hypothetical protein GPAL_2571 [Glaciecola pallidula DSM 14239 = ACAM 615]
MSEGRIDFIQQRGKHSLASKRQITVLVQQQIILFKIIKMVKYKHLNNTYKTMTTSNFR